MQCISAFPSPITLTRVSGGRLSSDTKGRAQVSMLLPGAFLKHPLEEVPLSFLAGQHPCARGIIYQPVHVIIFKTLFFPVIIPFPLLKILLTCNSFVGNCGCSMGSANGSRIRSLNRYPLTLVHIRSLSPCRFS